MQPLMLGAHGNQHSPEMTTPSQWKGSALDQSQNSPQNASASCGMHIAAPHNYTHQALELNDMHFLQDKENAIEKYKLIKANFNCISFVCIVCVCLSLCFATFSAKCWMYKRQGTGTNAA